MSDLMSTARRVELAGQLRDYVTELMLDNEVISVNVNREAMQVKGSVGCAPEYVGGHEVIITITLAEEE